MSDQAQRSMVEPSGRPSTAVLRALRGYDNEKKSGRDRLHNVVCTTHLTTLENEPYAPTPTRDIEGGDEVEHRAPQPRPRNGRGPVTSGTAKPLHQSAGQEHGCEGRKDDTGSTTTIGTQEFGTTRQSSATFIQASHDTGSGRRQARTTVISIKRPTHIHHPTTPTTPKRTDKQRTSGRSVAGRECKDLSASRWNKGLAGQESSSPDPRSGA
jgi:hypothetical protein